MAEVQLTRSFDAERKKLFEFLIEPSNWPRYYANVVEVGEGSWSEPGDTVECQYRLLGRKLNTQVRLDAMSHGEEVQLTGMPEGLPEIKQHWVHRDGANGKTETTVTLTTGETTNWFGKAIDRLVVPRALERDLSRTLDAIADLAPIEVA